MEVEIKKNGQLEIEMQSDVGMVPLINDTIVFDVATQAGKVYFFYGRR